MFMLLILAASMLTAPMGDIVPAGETDTDQVKFQGRVAWDWESANTYAIVSVYDDDLVPIGNSPVEVHDNGGFYSIYTDGHVASAGTPFTVECYLVNPGGASQICQTVSGIDFNDDFTWVWNQPPPGGYWQHIESFFFSQ